MNGTGKETGGGLGKCTSWESAQSRGTIQSGAGGVNGWIGWKEAAIGLLAVWIGGWRELGAGLHVKFKNLPFLPTEPNSKWMDFAVPVKFPCQILPKIIYYLVYGGAAVLSK